MAYGSVKPPSSAVHCRTQCKENCTVAIDSVLMGYEELALPFPLEDADIVVLGAARGTYVQWPRVWVRLVNLVSMTHHTHVLVVVVAAAVVAIVAGVAVVVAVPFVGGVVVVAAVSVVTVAFAGIVVFVTNGHNFGN